MTVQETTFYRLGTDYIYINTNGELIRSNNIVAENVRSFGKTGAASETLFYITNDNNLWGYGSNHNGILGDGTGVDRQEPVLIMEDVAEVYCGTRNILAIKTNGTLWRWGGGSYAPVYVTDDAVRVFVENTVAYNYQTNDGRIYTALDNLLLPEPVYDYVSFELQTAYYINAARVLIKFTRAGLGLRNDVYEEIATGVDRLTLIGSNLFYITLDGTLWGMGENSDGVLGDGTAIPRQEFVQIAENVAEIHRYAILKQDGTLWTWNLSDPVPRQQQNGVAALSSGNLGLSLHVHFQDNRVISDYGSSAQNETEEIRIPQVHTFRYY